MKVGLLVIALGLALAAAPALLTRTRTEGTGATPSRLEASLPSSFAAGEPITLEIVSDPGVVVTVLFAGAYGATARTIEMASATASVSAPFTTHAGWLHATAIAGDLVATASTVVEPGPVAEAPLPLVGARSIRADGADQTMVAIIPADRFGNPAPAGTPVAVRVSHPDESLARFDAEVTRTVAWTWVPSVTTAGDAAVVAAVDGVVGGPRTLVEVPGVPVPFALRLESPRLPADGATLVTVASDHLEDEYGNRLLDGTAVHVRADYPDGTSSFQTVVTVAGIARTAVEAPDRPGRVRVTMTALGVTSRSLDVEFRPADGNTETPGADDLLAGHVAR